MIAVLDVGATKTAVAAVSRDRDRASLQDPVRYRTGDWQSLAELVQDYRAKHDFPLGEAFLGVPGPVIVGKARCTNLPWEVSAERLQRELGLRSVIVMNDVEATARAIPALRREDVAVVHPGDPVSHGTIGLIAPGTGLGEAFLVWDGEAYRAHPSEGGHTDFAPADPVQWRLREYLGARLGHVSYERVCSGSGIPNIYAFLRDVENQEEPAWLAEQLDAAEDPTPLIFEHGKRPDGPRICRRAVDLFIEILGAKVGNFALTIFATGGVYLAGGIPPQIEALLRERPFAAAIRQKGRLAESRLMQRLMVRVVLRPKLALLGLAHAAGIARPALGEEVT